MSIYNIHVYGSEQIYIITTEDLEDIIWNSSVDCRVISPLSDVVVGTNDIFLLIV